MITTNKIEPKEMAEPKKSKVLNTNELEPKQYDFKRREIRGVMKRETRKVEGDMLTLSNYEDRQKEAKPFDAGQIKAKIIVADKTTVIVEKNNILKSIEEKKKVGRPRKKK